MALVIGERGESTVRVFAIFHGRLGLLLGLGGFALGDVTLMKPDFAGMGRLDIDPAPCFLLAFTKSHCGKWLAAFQHNDFGPFGSEILVAARGDGFVLGGPEIIRRGKEAIFAEQVAHDLAGIGFKIEQRDLGADGQAAEQPLCRVRNYADRAL